MTNIILSPPTGTWRDSFRGVMVNSAGAFATLADDDDRLRSYRNLLNSAFTKSNYQMTSFSWKNF